MFFEGFLLSQEVRLREDSCSEGTSLAPPSPDFHAQRLLELCLLQIRFASNGCNGLKLGSHVHKLLLDLSRLRLTAAASLSQIQLRPCRTACSTPRQQPWTPSSPAANASCLWAPLGQSRLLAVLSQRSSDAHPVLLQPAGDVSFATATIRTTLCKRKQHLGPETLFRTERSSEQKTER